MIYRVGRFLVQTIPRILALVQARIFQMHAERGKREASRSPTIDAKRDLCISTGSGRLGGTMVAARVGIPKKREK